FFLLTIMAELIKLKKGLEIPMKGEAEKSFGQSSVGDYIGFNPDDFYGIVPKPALKPGDAVKVGTVLFYDKKKPDVKIVSPVSGTLEAINRGDRRKILSIVVKNDKKGTKESLEKINLNGSVEDIKKALSDAGMFAFVKQRPYDVIANPADTPKSIFISAFDLAPLAADYEFIFKDSQSDFQNGIDVLSKIAPVFVGVKNGTKTFANVKNATVTAFEGKYPASNVGVQINNVQPINKGEIVWTIGAQEVVYIGRFAAKGVIDFSKNVALTGSEAYSNCYYKMVLGQKLSQILDCNICNGSNATIISGNPLSGSETTANDYLAPFVNQITVMKNGSDANEFMGWIMPRPTTFSTSPSILSSFVAKLIPSFKFNPDTRILGGQRNMIMSGEYDKVTPMDIYMGYLIKAIIAFDIDKMEALGIYEVAPEDFAAAECVCSSKMELQRIVREGLDKLQKEMC
ncbi:MAG: Na(+)-translocating NADH-quinone reductase subunit A, partial [Paludibacteraceae bacterium]|nr:Na(+)-translocating NADH-quinone reductase subunit A [Paludibacteraceae bacterium]